MSRVRLSRLGDFDLVGICSADAPRAGKGHRPTRRSHLFPSQHITGNPQHRLKSALHHGCHLFSPSLIRHPCLNRPTSPDSPQQNSLPDCAKFVYLHEAAPVRAPLEANNHRLDTPDRQFTDHLDRGCLDSQYSCPDRKVTMASVQPAPGMPPNVPALPPNLSQAQVQEVYSVCTLA